MHTGTRCTGKQIRCHDGLRRRKSLKTHRRLFILVVFIRIVNLERRLTQFEKQAGAVAAVQVYQPNLISEAGLVVMRQLDMPNKGLCRGGVRLH